MNKHHSVTQVKFWKEKKMKNNFLGPKKIFFGGEKISFFEKKKSKKILEKIWKNFFFIFFVDFFNIMVTYFDSNRFFQAKSLSYHIKQFLGLLIV